MVTTGRLSLGGATPSQLVLTVCQGQRLMSRRTCSFLPCHTNLYQPQVQKDVTQQVILKREKGKLYHDPGAKSLPDLVNSQPIRAKTRPKAPHSTWVPGQVTAQAVPRSYIINVDGHSYRRNRKDLLDTAGTVVVVVVVQLPPGHLHRLTG